MKRTVELAYPGSIVLSLPSNATTGFSWANATISDTTIMSQFEHNYVPPQSSTAIVGVAGKEVWTFKRLKAGKCLITLEYSQRWEGGQKAVWTCELDVTVK